MSDEALAIGMAATVLVVCWLAFWWGPARERKRVEALLRDRGTTALEARRRRERLEYRP